MDPSRHVCRSPLTEGCLGEARVGPLSPQPINLLRSEPPFSVDLSAEGLRALLCSRRALTSNPRPRSSIPSLRNRHQIPSQPESTTYTGVVPMSNAGLDARPTDSRRLAARKEHWSVLSLDLIVRPAAVAVSTARRRSGDIGCACPPEMRLVLVRGAATGRGC